MEMLTFWHVSCCMKLLDPAPPAVLCVQYTQPCYNYYVQGGFSPLFAASREGHTDVVDILVKAGADVHQTTAKV